VDTDQAHRTPTRLEASFQGGRGRPPTHLRVNGGTVYRVEWVRDVAPASLPDAGGMLVVSLQAYSEAADETLKVSLLVGSAEGDPSRPDWSSWRHASNITSTVIGGRNRTHGAAPSGVRGGAPRRPRRLDNPGLPEWRRGPCLGCGHPVVRVRDPHRFIGGTASGSWYVCWPWGPEHMASSGSMHPGEEIYLFGVCHQGCTELASLRLRGGWAELTFPLAQLDLDDAEMQTDDSRLPPADATCPFCGSSEELTDEHIWPRWVSKEFRTMGRVLSPLPGLRKPRREIDITTHVCRPCNNDWLGTLENDVSAILRPMLWGECVPLPPHHQVLIGTWAMKMAILIDRVTGSVVPRFYPMDLAIARQPSRNSLVYLGAYNGGRWAAHSARDLLHHANPGDSRPHQPTLLVSTFVVYKLAFQVLLPLVPVVDGTMGATTDSGEPERFVSQIWPAVDTPVQWPPRSLMGDEGLESLATRFSAPG